jgi:signal transduction histidine kinase/ligand-binding sensor domain-containing protein/DNA-binding NarL/FixJ family response regulator
MLQRYLKILVIFSSISILSQNTDENYVIDFITTKQGLSHNYSASILSDDLNMKWIGTENGITKFNGYNYDYIKPSDAYKGLLNENIEVLFLDNESNLWIGTKSGGISYLDIKNNSIKTYNYLIDIVNESDLRITSISQDSLGQIWIGTWKNGVFVIDFKNNKLIEHLNYYNPIYSIKKDFKNNMWFCSSQKLIMFDSSSHKLTKYEFKFPITDMLSDPSRNKVWVATSGKDTNLYSFDYSSEKISQIATNITSGFSKKLSIDSENRIWIGTWKQGVYRSNADLSNFDKINLVSNTSGKITSNYSTVLDIHHDVNNVTWLSTAGGGIVKILEGNGFHNIQNILTDQNLKESLNCTNIYKNDTKVFVGTLSKGLYYGENFSNLKKLTELGNVKVNALYEYNNQLFIGTADGFSILDLKTDKVIFSNTTIKKVTTFLISDAKLFLGTQQNGLAIVALENLENMESYLFYSDKQKKERKIESDRVTTIVKDKENKIWVGTYNGIHFFDDKTNSFTHQSKLLKEKLPSVIINSIAIRDDKIWLATPNGLIKLKNIDEKLTIEKIITKKEGLNSDFICALTFDDMSNIWFSTHTEIVKYDYIKNEILSYGDINGIKSTSFNNNSFFNYNNDSIFFGGIDDITYFNPSDIKNPKNIPEIVFTNLRVNNEIVRYKKGSKILSENFNYAKKIKLSYQENFFSTSFVVNDFLGNLNVKYSYLLEGNQTEWIDILNRNEINFAGLSPGKYTLKVKASRDNQNWSNPKSLDIILSGTPWLSNYAIFIYILLVSLITSYLIRSNNARIRLQNNLEIAKIDKEKEIELREAKLNFFTNISHEFRTPLTLIVGPLKELMDNDNLPPNVYKSLSYIDRNTNRLLNLINQLLDFRKADHGLLNLDASYGNFVRFSSEVYLYFKEAAEAKNITYSFKATKDEIYFPFDRNKMEIVLCNVISNALKYTSDGDKIKVKIDADEDFCIITVKDSGIGMKAKNLDKIFDRFFQIKSANSVRMVGSGIGLSFSKKIVELHHGNISVNSKINEGTEFTIKLAMNSSLYAGNINKNFMTSDNIKGYAKNSIPIQTESLNIESKKYSVLIIDDNPEILNYLKDILSDTYNVIEAENGDIGFKKASAEIPDVIISDVMMPGKDGITLCKELKSQITTSHIPIILLTARTSTVFEIEGLKTGANDYVTKPFDAKVIKARVESLLENRDILRAHLLNKVRFEPTASEIETDTDIENSFITKAILLVENNLENTSFGIDNMVDELNMSRSSLFRKIKSLTGLSLSAFIRSIRLKRAAHLILTSDLNLSQISFEVGFNDYKYFKTSFKKQFNCLPSKYNEMYEDSSENKPN